MTAEQIREQVPRDARLFPLVGGKKTPRSEHAHLDAVPVGEFLELYVSGNYGIALDGQFLLVDKDRDDEVVAAFEARLPETWMQKTWKRGTHRLYRVPRGFVGKNGRWPGGDLKVNGYLVGPGSVVADAQGNVGTYELVGGEYVEPVEAPSWLLDMLSSVEPVVRVVGADFDTMRAGSTGGIGRDNELASFGGFMRHKNYSEAFIAAALAGIVNSGVVEQPPGDEITAQDITRIARSVSKYTPQVEVGAIAASEWVCGSDVAIVGPPVKWWVRGFFPKDDFVTLFGASGVGKSSLASWLAAEVTKADGAFLFVGVEEPFRRFLGRAVLCDAGTRRERIFAVPQASRLVLPRDVPKLREQVRLAGISFVYFDSIYAHFERIQGENMAERARRCLGPLAEMAQDMGITVVGVFHENKEGDYLGSTEMVNVSRVTLHAERAENQPLFLTVHTTNLWEPPYAMTFNADEVEMRDPSTGEVQMEEVAPGEVVPMLVRVPKEGAKRERGVRMGDVVGAKADPDE